MPTSNQIDDLTSSKNGRNIQAKLQAKSHFFVEGAAYTQTAGQAFGALSTDVFRTTAKVNLSASKKIYAICRGQLFVQPQTGSTTKVNVILKPFTQPINGVGIKYFVYRGLTKSDFVASGEVAVASTTGLTQFLWDQFNNFYDNGVDPVPTFAEHYIGLPTATGSTQATTDLIDRYFNKITEVIDATSGAEEPNQMYELPIVPKGMHLSSISGDIGIDIVLDSGEYYFENDQNPFQLDLDFARKADSTIDISSITDSYQVKLYKEACTQFMDLAAFYGLHANGAGKLDMDDGATTVTSAADVYTKMAGFHTKNNLYIYIQANRQRSYNFYENYEHSDTNSNTINIGGTEAAMVETTFGTLGWPIHVFSETQNAGTSVNTLCFQLTTDNYVGAALYANIGNLTSEHEIGFVRGENLLKTPSTDPTITVDTNYTMSIESETPSQGANTISSILHLIYEGKVMQVEEYFAVPPVNPLTFFIKDIDDSFSLINAVTLKKLQYPTDLPTIVDERIHVVNFPVGAGAVDVGVVKHKRVNDRIQTVNETTFLDRVTYESLTHSIKQNIKPYSKTPISNIDSDATKVSSEDTAQDKFYSPKPPYFFNTEEFSDGSNIVTCLTMKTENGMQPTKKLLGISESENLLLKAIITSEILTNSSIYFENLLPGDGNNFVSPESVNYNKFKISLVGENQAGHLNLYRPSTDIYVYSIDEFVFTSFEYSEYVLLN